MKYVLIFSDGESIEAETCETRKEAHEKMVKSYEEYYPEDQNLSLIHILLMNTSVKIHFTPLTEMEKISYGYSVRPGLEDIN